MGGVACNGWRFWSVAGTEPKPRAKRPAKAAKVGKPAKKGAVLPKGGKKGKKAESRSRAARAASGDAYGCQICPETFPTMKAATAHAVTHTA